MDGEGVGGALGPGTGSGGARDSLYMLGSTSGRPGSSGGGGGGGGGSGASGSSVIGEAWRSAKDLAEQVELDSFAL